MPIRPFRKQKSADRQFNQMQSQLDGTLKTLRLSPFGGGSLITGLTMTGDGILVDHGLNAAYQGFVVLNAGFSYTGGPCLIYAISNPSATVYKSVDKSKQILLGGTAGTTFDLWVY